MLELTSIDRQPFVSLEHLLRVQRPQGCVLGFRGDAFVTWGQWYQRVNQWRAAIALAPGQRFALFHTDAIEFSAVLFALWAEDKIACVPGNNQPVTVASLKQDVDGFIGEFDSELTLQTRQTDFADEAFSPLVLDLNKLVMEVFTSGSSGEPQAIPKLLRQLSNEVNNLQSLWGELAADAAVFASVSHHHIYGLLFRVLWPLAAALPFDGAMANYLEDINQRVAAFPAAVLISSPTHLSRLPPLTDWSGLREKCRGIFSSGAPLPKTASLETQSLLHKSPIEVFGSSETGGVAWRQQWAEGESLWQAVPGITCGIERESGCLQIRSPYLATNDWYTTSDRVALHGDHRFELLGRVDRIAKVEGKRLSLTEMERRLESHPWIESAKVLVLQTKRSEVAAVVVLNETGSAELECAGRREINQRFSEHLAEQFERPLLPRRWRYPATMPVNQQGKVEQHRLMELFMTAPKDKPTLPEILKEELVDHGTGKRDLLCSLRIPKDLLYFEGHFEVAAILPGVVQLAWAEHYGRERLGVAGRFSHMEAIKFQHVIKPDAVVNFKLSFDANSNKLHFNFQSDAGQHSSGRVVFHD